MIELCAIQFSHRTNPSWFCKKSFPKKYFQHFVNLVSWEAEVSQVFSIYDAKLFQFWFFNMTCPTRWPLSVWLEAGSLSFLVQAVFLLRCAIYKQFVIHVSSSNWRFFCMTTKWKFDFSLPYELFVYWNYKYLNMNKVEKLINEWFASELPRHIF